MSKEKTGCKKYDQGVAIFFTGRVPKTPPATYANTWLMMRVKKIKILKTGLACYQCPDTKSIMMMRQAKLLPKNKATESNAIN